MEPLLLLSLLKFGLLSKGPNCKQDSKTTYCLKKRSFEGDIGGVIRFLPILKFLKHRAN